MNSEEIKIGIVGAGNIGSILAKLATEAGLEVFLSNSREPESLLDLSMELGSKAHAASVKEAISLSDIIIVSIPFSKFMDLPLDHFNNKIVIDAMNYIPHRDAAVKELLNDQKNQSQLLQEHLIGAKVVKAFSNIYSGHLYALSRPKGADDRSALPIAGDDESAKNKVVQFLDRIGWDAVDVGALAQSKLFDVGQPAFVKAYLFNSAGSGEEWGKRMYNDSGKPLNKQLLTELLYNK